MTGQRRAALPGRFDFDGTLYVLRDNIARADAYITAAERLIEEPAGGDSISRRRNHLAHLIESAKMALRAAIYAGTELDRHRGRA